MRSTVIRVPFSVLPSFTSFLFLYLKNNVPLLIVADLLYFVKTFIPEIYILPVQNPLHLPVQADIPHPDEVIFHLQTFRFWNSYH